MFNRVCSFAFCALLLAVSPAPLRAAADDEGPKLWEENKLTEVQPFPGKVLAVESSWGGYRLLLESAGEGDGEKRYCFAQVWPGGSPHLEYREIRKAELPKPGVTIVFLNPPVEVSRFSWSMGPWRIGREFGEEDCLRKVVAMEVKDGHGNGTGKFIGLPEAGMMFPIPEGAAISPAVGNKMDPVELKEIRERYTGSKFADIAHELARELGQSLDPLAGSIPKGKHATSGSIEFSFMLREAWAFHTKEAHGATLAVLMSVLEDPKVGSGRTWALREIKSRRCWGKEGAAVDESMPPVAETIRRLRVIAFNEEEEDDELRREIVPVLFEHGDPNEVLDLAIELSSRESDPLRMAEAFRFATEGATTERLTKENRAKYLSHGFLLLGRIDDGKTGKGYFLAGHLGSVIGIKPVREGQVPFAPDQQLPEYQGKHGLSEGFFQQTVDAAMAWWEKHRGEYEKPGN